jgi:hypothetical protein
MNPSYPCGTYEEQRLFVKCVHFQGVALLVLFAHVYVLFPARCTECIPFFTTFFHDFSGVDTLVFRVDTLVVEVLVKIEGVPNTYWLYLLRYL